MRKLIYYRHISFIPTDGIDIRIGSSWFGFHWYWQEWPLFDLIYHQRQGNVKEYGVILFGLWLYVKCDTL